MNTYTLPYRMLSLLEAFDTDAEFSATVTGLLRAHGHPNFMVPVVGQARWSDYPRLLSCANTDDYPVLIIALPHSIKGSSGEVGRNPYAGKRDLPFHQRLQTRPFKSHLALP
jgi:hypothetical protein